MDLWFCLQGLVFFCLYIQNGLNLFLLTAIYICAGEKKNSILLFASITFYDRLVI